MPLRTRSQSSRSPPPPNSSQPHHDDEDDDSSSNKENVQKRADFAPPKQYKKPWSRTPMLETQQQQQPPPDPAKPSPYQDREGRSRLPMDDDDFGPPIAECPNLGSFAEDSPPRRRSSPQYYASYRQSPPYYYYPSYEAWASPEYRRPSSPPNKKRRWNDESPFRSPVATEKGSNKFRRSPIWGGGGTPSIGMSGSFGIDTPGGTLDEFSPLGPSFAGFGDDFGSLRETLDPKLSLTTTTSSEERSKKPVIQQRTSSYFELPSSPRASPVKGYYPPKRHPASSTKRSLYASPLAPQSKRWSEPGSQERRPLRLELGEVGAKAGETRKSLEGINSMMMRGTPQGPPSGAPPPPQQPPPPPPRYEGTPSYRHEMTTPMKMGPPPPSSAGRLAPSSAGRMTPYPTSARKPPAPRYPTPRSTTTTPGKSPPSGKENTPVQRRRNPCNCKKSKCLKLYCECFAAERYCDGCNCNDCRNTKAYEDLRAKAMKDTRAKNPMAFKPRFSVRHGGSGGGGASPPSAHNMGCKCKRSECLKKYCECFQAGVMCGSKCKCTDCLNYPGSQALIDKRRKIKDHRGADFAMRVADEAWKGKHGGQKLVPRKRGVAPLPSPAHPPPHHGHPNYSMHHPHMMHGSPPPGHGPPHRGMPGHHYMTHMMMGPPHLGYSPMGMPPMTPSYMPGKPSVRSSSKHVQPPHVSERERHRTPVLATPRTAAIRLGFDPVSSKKKRKLRPGAKEATFPYFDKLPEQPKTTALAVFSFLSNDDLYNAGLVSKRWSRLAIDEELWQF